MDSVVGPARFSLVPDPLSGRRNPGFHPLAQLLANNLRFSRRLISVNSENRHLLGGNTDAEIEEQALTRDVRPQGVSRAAIEF